MKIREFDYRDLHHSFSIIKPDMISLRYEQHGLLVVSVYSKRFRGFGMTDRILVLRELSDLAPDVMDQHYCVFEGWVDRDEERKYERKRI